MSNLIEMTKKQLLELAKDNEIVGRHDMTKEQLIVALELVDAEQRGEEEGEDGNEEYEGDVAGAGDDDSLAAEVEKEIKTGKRLVKNTNLPWKRKFYYLDQLTYEIRMEEVRKAPTQVQLILKSMLEEGTVDEESSEMGVTICSAAIANGLKTKIEPHVLFAYYRKDMEELGLVFAGYNVDKD